MKINPRAFHLDSLIRKQFRLLRCRDGKSAQTEDQFTGEILHINERGMILLTNRPMPAEGLRTLALCGKGSGICEKLLGKIKKVEACGEEIFLVGVEFVSRVMARKLSSPRHPSTFYLGDKFTAEPREITTRSMHSGKLSSNLRTA